MNAQTATTAAVSARELNIKVKSEIAAAKAAALNDIKGTDKAPAKPKGNDKPSKGLREVTKKDKVTTPTPKKEAKPKLSEHIDGLIKAGGKWEDLIASATEFCKKNELKSKITIASFKTQVYWRTVVQKNPDYLTNLGMELTEKGIFKVKKAAKK